MKDIWNFAMPTHMSVPIRSGTIQFSRHFLADIWAVLRLVRPKERQRIPIRLDGWKWKTLIENRLSWTLLWIQRLEISKLKSDISRHDQDISHLYTLSSTWPSFFPKQRKSATTRWQSRGVVYFTTHQNERTIQNPVISTRLINSWMNYASYLPVIRYNDE